MTLRNIEKLFDFIWLNLVFVTENRIAQGVLKNVFLKKEIVPQ